MLSCICGLNDLYYLQVVSLMPLSIAHIFDPSKMSALDQIIPVYSLGLKCNSVQTHVEYDFETCFLL